MPRRDHLGQRWCIRRRRQAYAAQTCRTWCALHFHQEGIAAVPRFGVESHACTGREPCENSGMGGSCRFFGAPARQPNTNLVVKPLVAPVPARHGCYEAHNWQRRGMHARRSGLTLRAAEHRGLEVIGADVVRVGAARTAEGAAAIEGAHRALILGAGGVKRLDARENMGCGEGYGEKHKSTA